MAADTAPAVQPTQAAQLRQLIMGFRSTQLIYVAARLGLADLLRHGPLSAAAIAEAAGSDAQATYRLLRALAGMGLFAETADGLFELTPLAQPLLSDAPGSLRSMALLYGADWLWDAYRETLYSVTTGSTGFEHAHGLTLYEYLQQHSDAGATFDAAMSGYSGQEIAALLAAYPWSELRYVVDVGGGQGALLAALLEAYPAMRGSLLDRAPVAAAAAELLRAAGLEPRSSCVAGDFFAAVPPGGDAYILKSVLHNWVDADCVTILRRCREAYGAGGRLLVCERVMPPGNQPGEARLFDINMLVVTGGRERTAAEYGALFAEAGLTLTRVVQTASPLSIVEARPH